MEFADVKNDVAFRKIFGNDNRKETLISFLNAILAFKGKQKIAEVKIMNPYQLPKLRGGKVSIIDVKATDQVGRSYIVEMQVGELGGFAKRVQYYSAKSYSEQIKRGDFYRQLKPVIFIGILDYVFSTNPNYISRHQIRDVETQEHLLNDMEFNFIELPKFNKELQELETLTDKWIYFIKNAENLDVIPENVDDEGLKSAYKEANIHTWTSEELAAYDYTFMREEDERARFDAAMEKVTKKLEEEKKKLEEEKKKAAEEKKKAAEEKRKAAEEGKKEGEEIGKEIGKEIGEKIGEQKGKTQEKIEIAKKMILAGSANDFIVLMTDLSIEQIEQLRAEK